MKSNKTIPSRNRCTPSEPCPAHVFNTRTTRPEPWQFRIGAGRADEALEQVTHSSRTTLFLPSACWKLEAQGVRSRVHGRKLSPARPVVKAFLANFVFQFLKWAIHQFSLRSGAENLQYQVTTSAGECVFTESPTKIWFGQNARAIHQAQVRADASKSGRVFMLSARARSHCALVKFLLLSRSAFQHRLALSPWQERIFLGMISWSCLQRWRLRVFANLSFWLREKRFKLLTGRSTQDRDPDVAERW